MAEAVLLPDEAQFKVVNQVGLLGLNTFDDPKDIKDQELALVRNMIYDDGTIYPRQGSLLVLSKPSGETAAPFQLLTATNSKGIDYQIAVYGTNFYLNDPINSQWIKLNQTYSPVNTNKFYGSANWNNGINDDRFYFGNGVDDTMKWIMAVDSLANAAASTDTTLTLNSTTSFPASGTVVVAGTSGDFSLVYTSVGGLYTATTISFTSPNTISDSANGFVTAGFVSGQTITISGSANNNRTFVILTVTSSTITLTSAGTVDTEPAGGSITITTQGAKTLTLSGTVGQIVPKGATVTMAIQDATLVPVGSVFTKSQGRLFVANAQGAENTINYSVSANPESYTISSTATSGGFYTLFKGKGGILGMTDYGQYLTIEKQDVISNFSFNLASDNSGFIVVVDPIISGDGIGPASSATILNYMNVLYYPTVGEGIVGFSPNATGNTTTSGVNLISQQINNLITQTLNFSLSRTCGANQKLYWLVAQPTIGVPVNVNNLVLMYDLIRSAWSVFDNWNAVDVKPANGNVYYLNVNDGALYLYGVGYQDAVNGNPTSYNAVMLTKRFDLDNPEQLMRGIYVYVQGYISLNTTFYITILFNENGSLGKQTYAIQGNNQNITALALGGGLGFFPLAIPLLGGVDLSTMQALENPLFFRAYLEISQALRPHNIQVQAYSVQEGSQWGLSSIVPITVPDQSIETRLVLSPGTAPVIQL